MPKSRRADIYISSPSKLRDSEDKSEASISDALNTIKTQKKGVLFSLVYKEIRPMLNHNIFSKKVFSNIYLIVFKSSEIVGSGVRYTNLNGIVFGHQ